MMILGMWITAIVGMRYLNTQIQENGSDIEEVADEQQVLESDLQRVDQKQDHIVNRQEMVLERVGMNAQEIQEIQEETARLDERHQAEDTFYRGGSPGEGD